METPQNARMVLAFQAAAGFLLRVRPIPGVTADSSSCSEVVLSAPPTSCDHTPAMAMAYRGFARDDLETSEEEFSDEEEDYDLERPVDYSLERHVDLESINHSKTFQLNLRSTYTRWEPWEAFRELVQNW